MPGLQRHELFLAHLTALSLAWVRRARPAALIAAVFGRATPFATAGSFASAFSCEPAVSFGSTAREYGPGGSCSGGGMRPSAAIMRAMRALSLLVMAFAVCLSIAATGSRHVPLGKGPTAWAGAERASQGNRQSDDPAPDDDNEASDADVDDGDQKLDAFIAPAGLWLGQVPRSGSRLIQVQRRIWRSLAQLGVALPRAPPALR